MILKILKKLDLLNINWGELSMNLYYLKCLINRKNIRKQIKILYKIGIHQFFQLMETT